MRQNIDHLEAILLAASRGDLMAEHRLLAGIVHERGVDELGVLIGLPDGPTGETARDRDDILLGIAAVHP